MAIASIYVFDHTDLRGNFSFQNFPNFSYDFHKSWSNSGSTSILSLQRVPSEWFINLHGVFNNPDFLYLIDIAPEINRISKTANGNALMFVISERLSHYGYRSSDVRAGWTQWRYVPYHNQEPNRYQDSHLLNQIAFNFHIKRGVGTVDNEGWIAFYYNFFLDGTGRLGASVDGWAYHLGGGQGLVDGTPDVGPVIKAVVPPFINTVQTFLDSFCSTAGLGAMGLRDSNGYPLFARFYLLPGDGNNHFGMNTKSGYPEPGIGNSSRPIDAEVSLALQASENIIISYSEGPPALKSVSGVIEALEHNGWRAKTSDQDVGRINATREIDGRTFEIEASIKEIFSEVSDAAPNEKSRYHAVKDDNSEEEPWH